MQSWDSRRAPLDGHTLLMGSAGETAINKNPGEVSYVTSGVGNPQRLNGELLEELAQIKMIHVPYLGAAGQLADAAGGNVDMTLVGTAAAARFIHDKRVKPIAVTSAKITPENRNVTRNPSMHPLRRITLNVVASIAVAAAISPVLAQAPLELKITAPAAPGGGWDGAARSLQQVLTATGGAKSVQVVNVPGAGGTVGLAQFVNTAKGDGNQLMVMGITMVGAILTNKAPVGLDSVTPIARLTGDALVIVVPANSPHKTLKDLAAALKADTSKVVWAGGSAGGADHILAGLVAKAAGGDASKLNYVPFSGGGEALAEMLGGRVTAGISGYNEFESQIKAGKLRALAISTGKRMPGVDVPTIKEQGLDVEVVNWRGIVAGPGISAAQKGALVGAVNKALKSDEWTKVRQQRGWDDAYLDADAFAAFLKSDQARVKEVLTTIGLVK